MNSKKIFRLSGAVLLSLSMGACSTSTAAAAATAEASASTDVADSVQFADYAQDTAALTIDNSKWSYDADNNVYYQIGISYAATADDADYETMAVYVPGAYMNATANGDGTYTCTVNASGTAGSYTAATAPVVFPVNTPGYAAQAAATSYSYDGLSDYLSAGFIYVYAGLRGRITSMSGSTTTVSDTYDGGAPWGVTDLKAAIRCYRLNASELPGNAEEIYTFGMSGGGAQSALAGATGDSALYYPYLEKIGAAMKDADGNAISDAVAGSMCWCPITSLSIADEAYEWNMGQFMDSGTRADGTWTKSLSSDLANAFASYINNAGLVDENGNTLTLSESSSGIYLSGTYYDYLMKVITQSLNNFLSDTTFPYTPNSSTQASGNFGGGGTVPSGSGVSGGSASGTMPSGAPGGSMPSGGMGGSTDSSSSTTYETVQDYIDSLNADGTWITYDASTNTASITSLADFVTHCKTATKDVGAFDAVDASQGENAVFGNGNTVSKHFDSLEANLISTNQSAYSALSGWDSSYLDAYAEDLAYTDEIGTGMTVRTEMYDPMYYLLSGSEGSGTSTVAAHWRIRTGIDQGDTANTTEINLALALNACSSVKDVDFETVWGLGHTMAERTGDSTTNFITWVNQCVAADAA